MKEGEKKRLDIEGTGKRNDYEWSSRIIYKKNEERNGRG